MDPTENKDNKTITNETVRYVAGLSRLSLGEEDVTRFKDQLSTVLDFISQLNEVDTDGVKPTTHVLSNMKNVFREDELKPSLVPEEALKNSPDKKEGFFRVPRVIREN